jgi:hypothetical protein
MLVQKQLAHFNDEIQGKTALQKASEAPKKKGALPFTQITNFKSTIILAALTFCPHAGLFRRLGIIS